jgi:DNA-binding NtrC family response regulator
MTTGRRVPRPLAVMLRVTGAPATPREHRLSSGSCVFGAGSKADVVVEDPAISRRHVELTLCPEGVAVHDLDSRNGTYYLGQRIERAVLSPGSRLRIGAAEIAIDADVAELGDAKSPTGSYRGLSGRSEAMRKLVAILTRLEGSLVSVLVEGESGVGKELVVRALHAGSQIAEGPFVVVNCGTVSRELVLSELFGHRRGAFTGAHEDRIGAFEAAHGGTLFLDEIGELPLDTQPTLLRALESGEVKRLGDGEVRKVKVRVVAATNRDLLEQVEQGAFRHDLFYRLGVVRLRIPPLSERLSDIPILCRELCEQAGAGELPADVVTDLSRRHWPGNVRELKNAVLSYLALGELPEPGARPAPLLALAMRQSLDLQKSYQQQKEQFVSEFSRVYFEALLEQTHGNQSEAARISGVERSYLSKLIAKYGLKP